MKKNQDKDKDVVVKSTDKKVRNERILPFIKKYLSERNLEYFIECGNFLEFITTKDGNKKKLVKMNSCKNRFCPFCAWRKANKDALMISIIMEALKEEQNKEFLFLTLTTPNVPGSKVKNEIDHFNKSFNKMFKRTKVISSIKGYARKLEMTYNADRDDYNPHFHVLLVVDKSYFTNSRRYINQKEWLEMWREATGMDEITQVHVKKVNLLQGNAVAEIAKYSAKDSDMTTNEDVFDVFYKSLKGRQLITFNGLMKEYVAKFKKGELDKYKNVDVSEYFYLLRTEWQSESKQYEQLFRELTEDEKAKYNKNLINEIETED